MLTFIWLNMDVLYVRTGLATGQLLPRALEGKSFKVTFPLSLSQLVEKLVSRIWMSLSPISPVVQFSSIFLRCAWLII